MRTSSISDGVASDTVCGALMRREFCASSTAETTYDTASITIVIGAVSNWISTPASPGPPISATESVACSFELPSTRCSRPINTGRYALSASSNSAENPPTSAATTYKLRDPEMPEPRCQRNAEHQHRARDVGPDQHRTFRVAIDEAAGEQAHHHTGNHLERAEHRDLHRIGRDQQNRDHRQRRTRDAAAERADGLRRPQVHEVAMPRERPERPKRESHQATACGRCGRPNATTRFGPRRRAGTRRVRLCAGHQHGGCVGTGERQRRRRKRKRLQVRVDDEARRRRADHAQLHASAETSRCSSVA